MEKLSATTKELIFNRIEKLKCKIEGKQEDCNKKKEEHEHLIEYWYIDIQLMDEEIEKLKQLLFNN
jgi:hypothetical protein